MPSRFYLDEDVPIGLTRALLNAGDDAVHVSDRGTKGRTDGYHLWQARSEQRILVAYNRKDYLLLHDALHRWAILSGNLVHSGILWLPQMLSPLLFRAIDEFVASGLPTQNEFYSYDPVKNWIKVPFVP